MKSAVIAFPAFRLESPQPGPVAPAVTCEHSEGLSYAKTDRRSCVLLCSHTGGPEYCEGKQQDICPLSPYGDPRDKGKF